MNAPLHTPTPWAVTASGAIKTADLRLIPLASTWREDAWCDDDGTDESRANAAFIVRAVNSHDDLVETLKDVTIHLIAASSLLSRSPKKAAPSNKMFDRMLADYQASAERGRAALSKANGDA